MSYNSRWVDLVNFGGLQTAQKSESQGEDPEMGGVTLIETSQQRGGKESGCQAKGKDSDIHEK